MDNRSRMVEGCEENKLIISNTRFDKPQHELLTFKAATTPACEIPYHTSRFSQIDHIIVMKHWKSYVTNITNTHMIAIASDRRDSL